VKWLLRGIAAALALYLLAFGLLAVAMSRPPAQFGQIIKHVPMALVWGVLPGQRIWMWARDGSLRVGDIAPDFALDTYNHSDRVRLSSHRGQRPVVLVFGSYT
jgi:hypothetical protein